MELLSVLFGDRNWKEIQKRGDIYISLYIYINPKKRGYIYIHIYIHIYRASLMAQVVKCLPAMRETWVRSLAWEDPLEKEIATHFSILAWEIPRTGEPGGPQSTGS